MAKPRVLVEPADAAWHGTAYGYKHYKCRCQPCTAARTEESKASKARRVARTPFDQIPHGLNGYMNYNCRCGVCKQANSASLKEQRAARMRRPFDQIPHGLAGYQSYGCHCEVCKQAGKDLWLRKKAARKGVAHPDSYATVPPMSPEQPDSEKEPICPTP